METITKNFDESPLLIGVVEIRGDSLFSVTANKAAREFLNLPCDQQGEINFLDVNIPPNEVAFWINQYRECLKEKKSFSFEQESVENGIKKVRVSVLNYSGVGISGYPRFSYVTQDVTEKKMLINELSAHQFKLNTALNFGKMGIWECNPDLCCFYWSHTMRQVFDLDDSVNINPIAFSDLLKIIHVDDRFYFMSQVNERVTFNEEIFVEFRVSSSDRGVIWIQWRGKPSYDLDGKCVQYIGTAQDVTEFKKEKNRRSAEISKLTHLSKLSALGEMATAMAHEINNPISIILGYADLLVQKADTAESIQSKQVIEYSNEIRTVCERVSQIIMGLKFASQDGEGELLEIVDLTKLVKQSLAFSAILMNKYSITLKAEVSDQAIYVMAKGVQISQVILNLVSNAIDAAKNSKNPWIKVKAFQDKNSAIIEVIDSGQGISEKNCKKIFSPFFTTKPVGEGMGIGLSISKGIIDAHQGKIEWVSNQPGACFQVNLPITKAKTYEK